MIIKTKIIIRKQKIENKDKRWKGIKNKKD